MPTNASLSDEPWAFFMKCSKCWLIEYNAKWRLNDVTLGENPDAKSASTAWTCALSQTGQPGVVLERRGFAATDASSGFSSLSFGSGPGPLLTATSCALAGSPLAITKRTPGLTPAGSSPRPLP